MNKNICFYGLTPATIVSKYDTSVGQPGLALLYLTDGRIRFTLQGTDGYRYVDTDVSELTIGAWTHVAATFDLGSQDLKIFVNGVPAPASLGPGSSPISAIQVSAIPVRLGTLVNASGALDGLFNGLLDEVSLYQRSLSPGEVSSLHAAGSAGMCR